MDHTKTLCTSCHAKKDFIKKVRMEFLMTSTTPDNQTLKKQVNLGKLVGVFKNHMKSLHLVDFPLPLVNNHLNWQLMRLILPYIGVW